MSGFDVRFVTEGVLHVQGTSAEAAESHVVAILEALDLWEDADATWVESCTVRAVGEVAADGSGVSYLDRPARCVAFTLPKPTPDREVSAVYQGLIR